MGVNVRTNYTCLKEIGENPPSTEIPFISFDNFLWSLLTSLQLVTLDSWEIVYNVVSITLFRFQFR